mmetsp:Transcript_86177/g.167000  ORF Transcript_86177/g.167000 Transcript_86177/m.167000 type:complete len:205 (+) Transcript_86177:946-1560(+)
MVTDTKAPCASNTLRVCASRSSTFKSRFPTNTTLLRGSSFPMYNCFCFLLRCTTAEGRRAPSSFERLPFTLTAILLPRSVGGAVSSKRSRSRTTGWAASLDSKSRALSSALRPVTFSPLAWSCSLSSATVSPPPDVPANRGAAILGLPPKLRNSFARAHLFAPPPKPCDVAAYAQNKSHERACIISFPAQLVSFRWIVGKLKSD